MHSPAMLVYKPPAPWTAAADARVVFLAGSIEMGAATDWQAALTLRLPPGVVVLNPRRDAWDASWRQSIDEPRFREQVEWELDGLERADVIAMWFAPETRAPITLLELGLHARDAKLIVGCPDGYWRKGNVEVVCARFGRSLAGDWEAFVADVQRALAATRGAG
ncbi:MAG: nucleoside 2-deoxyribosyltransferase domain-containing protein [Kofleriaceae bacterium]